MKMALNLFPTLSCFIINYGAWIHVNLSMQNNIFQQNFMNYKSAESRWSIVLPFFYFTLQYHHLESQTVFFITTIFSNIFYIFVIIKKFQISKIYNSNRELDSLPSFLKDSYRSDTANTYHISKMRKFKKKSWLSILPLYQRVQKCKEGQSWQWA